MVRVAAWNVKGDAHMSDSILSQRFSRRTALGLGMGAALAPFLGACSGASTSGGGDFTFLSTQFTPVEEKQRFEKILATHVKDVKVSYNAMAVGDLTTQVTTQVKADKVGIGMVGGLHGELAQLADSLEDLDGLADELKGAGIPENLWELSSLGGDTSKYIPWMQATYVVAVNKAALEHLPSGADVNALTYDQYLDWAIQGRKATGKPIIGFPAGPKGLYHRWFQGFLLPSFTGGQITTFTSPEAITAWTYMQELWANMNPASTNYDNMQEPLARGEVLVGWDHVARLIDAPKDKPDEWIMVPAPTGPKGLGYMLVLAGYGVPKGGDLDAAEKVIKDLSKPEAQLDVLRQNAFFPAVGADIPEDLPPAVKLEAAAVKAQQEAENAIISVPPVGLGDKDGEVSQVFKDCFTQICKEKGDPAKVLPAQAKVLQGILDQVKVPCWAPDPVTPGETCQVG
jgi:multiple sugar transport system substrate-binding protein